VQQDRSFYDSQKFKYRFNEDHTSYLKTPSVKYEPALPPKQKNHAAGVGSDWACKPIPGEAKRWAYSTVSSFKNVAESQILTPDALARAQSSYHKKRNLDKIDHFSTTQENIANGDGGLMNFGNPNDDKASILTVDRLRKFNDINGYEHGPAAEAEGAGAAEDNEEENRDKVEELATPMRAKGGRKYLNG